MSIQLKIELPLKTVVELRNNTDEDCYSWDGYCHSSGATNKVMTAVKKALDDLPYSITTYGKPSAVEASTTSLDDALPDPIKGLSLQDMETSVADEKPVEKMPKKNKKKSKYVEEMSPYEEKPTEDEEEPMKEEKKSTEAEKKNITVNIRDNMNKDEFFEMHMNDTIAELYYAYAYRVAFPTDKFMLHYDGTALRLEDDLYLGKAGFVDHALVHAYPVYTPPKYSSRYGPTTVTMEYDTIPRKETPKAKAPAPSETTNDYDWEVRSIQSPTEESTCDCRNDGCDGKEEDSKLFEITIRDLMNQTEVFNVAKHDTLFELAERYGNRTGLDTGALRFKLPDGAVHDLNAEEDDGEMTLGDFDIVEGEVIVAMPDSINF